MVQFGRKAPWILEVFPQSGPVPVMTLGVSKQQTITDLRDLEDKRNLNRFKILKDNPKPWLFLVIQGDYIAVTCLVRTLHQSPLCECLVIPKSLLCCILVASSESTALELQGDAICNWKHSSFCHSARHFCDRHSIHMISSNSYCDPNMNSLFMFFRSFFRNIISLWKKTWVLPTDRQVASSLPLLRHFMSPWLWPLTKPLRMVLLRSPAEGALSVIAGALKPQATSCFGRYMDGEALGLGSKLVVAMFFLFFGETVDSWFRNPIPNHLGWC